MLQTSHLTLQQGNTLVNTYSCVTIKRVSAEVTFLPKDWSKVTAYLWETGLCFSCRNLLSWRGNCLITEPEYSSPS